MKRPSTAFKTFASRKPRLALFSIWFAKVTGIPGVALRLNSRNYGEPTMSRALSGVDRSLAAVDARRGHPAGPSAGRRHDGGNDDDLAADRTASIPGSPVRC